jgi:antitoxin component of MazEF toxin-antitoxin module
MLKTVTAMCHGGLGCVFSKMEVAAQNEGAQVDLTIESGKVVLTPIESGLRIYTLDELLAGITEENLHGETLRSAPVGNEIV